MFHHAGQEFCKALITRKDDFNAFVAELQEMLKKLKIGLLRVEKSDIESMKFTLTVAEFNDPPEITSEAVTAATEEAPYSCDVEAYDEENDPLQKCIAWSESENLWVSARRLLNDEVFAAMWLRYAEDMSVKDISKTLDRSVSWTKVNLMRGRRVLDAELNGAAETSEAYG